MPVPAPSAHPCSALRPALLALCLGVVGAFGQPAVAQDSPEPANADAGAFLAARAAASQSDYSAAADWFARALLSDPRNPDLLKGAIVANIGLGEFGPAANMEQVLEELGTQSQAGYAALLVRDIQAKDYEAVLARTAAGTTEGALLDQLLTAWAQVGLGRMSDATETFDRLVQTSNLAVFGLYHKALALASAGDFEGANRIFSAPDQGARQMSGRGVLAHATVLSQLERNADALALLNASFDKSSDPQLQDFRRRLEAGEPVPFDIVANAQEGLAEVFYTVAVALGQENDATHTLIYARGAQALRPDQEDVVLLVAELLQSQNQHDLAIEVYGSISPDSPTYHIAEIGRAMATHAAGRAEAAIEILQGLTRAKPDLLVGHVALADAYRRAERFEEARAVYTTAIDLLGTPAPENWPLFFSRGICAERLGDFEGSVIDLREALRLNPDQPQVLNYLGYSYVDRGENLEEALGMIERAVAMEPGSGYIIDSLAWAYYRLGRYQDAVEPMERASLLEPVDPIVTDHLGDVYWAVGRYREAEFQWHRALSYGPEDKDATRIRRKLDIGLDAVLAEEGAPPLSAIEAKAAP